MGKQLHNTTSLKAEKPMIISASEFFHVAMGQPPRVWRCGPHGKKGRKGRDIQNRQAIKEQP
jgi:hypothetical protein